MLKNKHLVLLLAGAALLSALMVYDYFKLIKRPALKHAVLNPAQRDTNFFAIAIYTSVCRNCQQEKEKFTLWFTSTPRNLLDVTNTGTDKIGMFPLCRDCYNSLPPKQRLAFFHDCIQPWSALDPAIRKSVDEHVTNYNTLGSPTLIP